MTAVSVSESSRSVAYFVGAPVVASRSVTSVVAPNTDPV
jgi:hypothetical protein